MNLALVLEAAGKYTAAGDAYESALEGHANYLPAIQGLARAAVRDGRDDSRLVGWLETIAMEADDEWRAWARGRLAAGRCEWLASPPGPQCGPCCALGTSRGIWHPG